MSIGELIMRAELLRLDIQAELDDLDRQMERLPIGSASRVMAGLKERKEKLAELLTIPIGGFTEPEEMRRKLQ